MNTTIPSHVAPHASSLFVVSFSGGKDSVATWLLLERTLGLRVSCVFADTGHESDDTYEYLDLLVREHACPLVTVYPRVRHIWKKDPPERVPRERWDDILDMQGLVEQKGRPPGAKSRFCTTILKLRPLAEHVAGISDPYVMASGVRAEESTKRAHMATWAFDDFMSAPRWLPIHDWPAERVFDLHRQCRVPPNPLYLKGCSRVGCFPCILARKAEIAVVARDRKANDRMRAIEASSGRTFFPRKMVSKRYRSKIDPKTKLRICTWDDVVRWATDQQPDFQEDSLFAGQDVPFDYGDDIEAEACSSVYGLCE